MQLKHGAPEFAIPAKPTALELRLRSKSRRLRLSRSDRLREGVSAGEFAGDIEGEEIGGGGIGRSALGRGERDFVAENGVLFEVVGIVERGGGGRERKWTESFVYEGFGNLLMLMLLLLLH